MSDSRDSRLLVVHVVHRFAVGGLENVIVSLINRLPGDTYRHAVVALTEVTAFRERITRPDVEYLALHKGPGHAVRLYPELFRYFRRTRPAIVHTCNLAALEAVVPAWLAGVPARIHAEHGWDVHDTDGSNEKYRLLRKVYRPFVNHYIAVSPQLARYMTGRAGARKQDVSLIFNGVDTDRFTPARPPGEAIPRLPFQGADVWTVGTVGRMQPIKNQTLLAGAFVRALAIEPAAAASLRLVMVGDGPLRAEAAQILSSAGVGHLAWLPGECDDVGPIMRAMDCFVLPSLAEGTSCTIQEAMASSLPVIATDVGGNADLVSHGKTGTIVPSGDVDAMARSILSYWNSRSLALRHGAAGRARVTDAFSMRGMVESYDRLFSSTAAGKATRATAHAA
jgi:sugar transferase (PEP-CTERM/EpsH1 system associated)